MPNSIITFGLEDNKVDIINDHMIIVKALKSDVYNFGDEENVMNGFISPQALQNAAELYSGVPVYVDHQRTKFDQVGIVRTAYFNDPFVYAVIELFDQTEAQNQIIALIRNGKIGSVSSAFNFIYYPTGGDDSLIAVDEISPYEVSLMLDYVPRCPECVFEYRNFGEPEEGTEEIAVAWIVKHGDGKLGLRLSTTIKEMGMRDAMRDIFNQPCPCKSGEELGEEEKETSEVEVKVDLSKYTTVASVDVIKDGE